jgi:hypothetical protein
MTMTREQALAFIDAMYSFEEVKADAIMQQKIAAYQYHESVKHAQRKYEDASDAQNIICDIAGVRRVNPSFHKISDDYRPLDVVYADHTGEVYNDGLSNSILGRALSGIAKAAGWSRDYLDNYHRIG